MSQPVAPRRISLSCASADRAVRRLAGTGRPRRRKYVAASSSSATRASLNPSAADPASKGGRSKVRQSARYFSGYTWRRFVTLPSLVGLRDASIRLLLNQVPIK